MVRGMAMTARKVTGDRATGYGREPDGVVLDGPGARG